MPDFLKFDGIEIERYERFHRRPKYERLRFHRLKWDWFWHVDFLGKKTDILLGLVFCGIFQGDIWWGIYQLLSSESQFFGGTHSNPNVTGSILVWWKAIPAKIWAGPMKYGKMLQYNWIERWSSMSKITWNYIAYNRGILYTQEKGWTSHTRYAALVGHEESRSHETESLS